MLHFTAVATIDFSVLKFRLPVVMKLSSRLLLRVQIAACLAVAAGAIWLFVLRAWVDAVIFCVIFVVLAFMVWGNLKEPE
jgi:hypothetical protein